MGLWVCMNKMGLCVCVLHLPWKSNSNCSKGILGRALRCQKINSGKCSFIKTIATAAAGTSLCTHAGTPPCCPSHTPLCLRHSCTTRWQSSFQLQSMQDTQPFSYQSTIPSEFVLLIPTLPNKHPALCCPTTGVPKVYTWVVLQWYHNGHCSQKGRPESAQGLKRPAKARTGIPEIISFPIDYLLLPFCLFPWTAVVVSCSTH